MEAATINTGIQQALKKLGVKPVTYGTSTGSDFFGGGEEIASYSPVDGKLIGKVIGTTKDDYERVIDAAQGAFKTTELSTGSLSREILMMVLGCFAIYGVLFFTGYVIMGNMMGIVGSGVLILLTGGWLLKMMKVF